MTAEFVSVQGVTRRFGSVVAVNGAGLDVAEGKLMALLGPSGCGKTTLLRLIGGLDAPDEGTIAMDGLTLSGPRTFVPPERRRIAMVFQDFALFPHMNVARNVAFGVPSGGDREGRVRELLAMVGLEAMAKRMPHELSGGEQQRVALARALASEPRLILLDEPFSNLDPSVRGRVRHEVQQLLRQTGITAVFVTHDQDEALSLADSVAVMIGGRILQVGSPAEIYRRPASKAVAEFVGQPNFLPGQTAGGMAACELGEFPVEGDVPGAVEVMIRMEDIVPATDGGIAAKVTGVAYYGHEQVVTLLLPGGEEVRARWRKAEPIVLGSGIQIEVDGDVRAFAAS